jgi:2-methylaconitate cis-trans-isomerase PrpF
VTRALPVVVMRGGTSKGVFVRDADLPAAGLERDEMLLALMGSPDPMQLDGLGGTHSSTSKVVLVSPSSRPDCDIDYLAAQVLVDRPFVDYAGNCGNLTTAVGPYAIDEGMVAADDPVTVVRLFNYNTNVRILAHVPVEHGRARTTGDCSVAGVPGTGAPVVTEYLDPAGAVLGALLPTGNACDVVTPRGGTPLAVSLIDVAGPVAFLRAADLGVAAPLDPTIANADADLLERLEATRAACAVLAGLAPDDETAWKLSPALPRLALVGEPRPTDGAHLAVRVVSMQRVHHACPMTVLLCTAAGALVPGTVPNSVARTLDGAVVRVAHPKGVAEAAVRLDDDRNVVRSVSVTRTARRLLAGEAYLP